MTKIPRYAEKVLFLILGLTDLNSSSHILQINFAPCKTYPTYLAKIPAGPF